jgi:hypothetical protein
MELPVNIRDTKSEESFSKLLEHEWPFKIVKSKNHEDALALIIDGVLHLMAENGQNPIPFSWTEKLNKWKHDKTISNNLKKALGASAQDIVIDATVGFGQDTSYLLHYGLNVIGFERVPLLYFLQKGSLILCPEKINLELVFGMASDSEYRDLPIYFDPMFDNGSKRKAKAKKSMSILHKIIGADEDAVSEAEKLRSISSRLVIKKSPRDPELLKGRNSSWESKAVRFDLYL